MRVSSASAIPSVCFVSPDSGSVTVGSEDVSGTLVLASTSISEQLGGTSDWVSKFLRWRSRTGEAGAREVKESRYKVCGR